MEEKTDLIHNFEGKTTEKKQMKNKNFIVVIVIVLGIGTGFLLAFVSKPSFTAQKAGSGSQGAVQKGQIVGSADEKTFNDTAEGTLKEGGIEGEGAYHLVRPGGDSQNVYLTSSAVDLAPYVGKKVKVWGQTNAAQKAGWLMDVGRIKIVELNAAKPF